MQFYYKKQKTLDKKYFVSMQLLEKLHKLHKYLVTFKLTYVTS